MVPRRALMTQVTRFMSVAGRVSIALFAALATTLLAVAPIASAQSPEAVVPVPAEKLTLGIYRLDQDPYSVTVQMIPSVPAAGTVHFVVTPELISDGSAVTNAIVLVVVDDEEGVPTYQSLALNSPDQPTQYKANILVKRAGEWTVRVNLRIDGRELEISVPLAVIERASTDGTLAGTVAFLVVLAALAGGGAYIALSIRRRRRADPAGPIGDSTGPDNGNG